MPAILKRNILLSLALLIFSVVFIAAALPQQDVQPGQPLPGAVPRLTEPGAVAGALPAPISTSTFFKALLGFLFILFLPIVIVGLVKQSPWRRILRYLAFSTLLTMVALSLLTILTNTYGANIQPADSPVISSTAAPPVTSPLGSPPGWLVWLVFSLLAALVGGAGLWIIFTATHRLRAENRLAEEAQRAVDALNAGTDLKNVILRCYLQMSLALQQEQGIERGKAMTAREFERLLEARGVPREPVRGLTRLFEAVRYGTQQPGVQDEQAALDCLNAIIQSSQGAGRGHE